MGDGRERHRISQDQPRIEKLDHWGYELRAWHINTHVLGFEVWEWCDKHGTVCPPDMGGVEHEVIVSGSCKWDSCWDIYAKAAHFCGVEDMIETFRKIEELRMELIESAE
jgi:hypothetical protein